MWLAGVEKQIHILMKEYAGQRESLAETFTQYSALLYGLSGLVARVQYKGTVCILKMMSPFGTLFWKYICRAASLQSRRLLKRIEGELKATSDEEEGCLQINAELYSTYGWWSSTYLY